MAHGDAREGKWRRKMRMEWVASSLALYVGTRSIQSLSTDPHTSAASSWLNWQPRRFKWIRPFRWKTKCGFCACAITFRTCYTYYECVCSLRCPACNAHAPYCHLWPARLHIFPHYLINGTIFRRKKSYWTQNGCFDFLYDFCVKHFSF